MHRRRALATICILAALSIATVVAAASPALAGGTWLEFDADSYEPGDTVRATASVGRAQQGWTGDGPFYAHLRPPGSADSRTEPLATATISPGAANDARIELQFVVPDVDPGEWYVDVCNAGCERGIGDLVGGIITIREASPEALPETGVDVRLAFLGAALLLAGLTVLAARRKLAVV